MSDAWNVAAPDELLETLNLRAKHRLLELQTVLRHTYDRKSVSEIARLLGCSRNKVIWMQHVLELRWLGRGELKGTGKGLGTWPREAKAG